MNYVFCGAYRPLFFALYLRDMGEDVTVITYNEAVRDFCADTSIKCVHFELVRPAIKTIYQVITLKNRMDNLIKKIDFRTNDSFYLLANMVSYEAFYLAKKLSKKGKAYFKNPEREFKIYHGKLTKEFIKMNVIKYLLKIFLGLELMFYETNNNPRFGIDDKFLEKHNILKTYLDKDYDQLILEVSKKSNIPQKQYDNLVIDQGSGATSVIDYSSLINIYRSLLALPLEFAFKKHPEPIKVGVETQILDEGLLKDCGEIPENIPVELVFNSIKRNVISAFSTSLIVASQMEHLKAISLLELVEWYNQAYKTEFKNYLVQKSNNSIIFVNSFEELKEILLNP